MKKINSLLWLFCLCLLLVSAPSCKDNNEIKVNFTVDQVKYMLAKDSTKIWLLNPANINPPTSSVCEIDTIFIFNYNKDSSFYSRELHSSVCQQEKTVLEKGKWALLTDVKKEVNILELYTAADTQSVTIKRVSSKYLTLSYGAGRKDEEFEPLGEQ